MIGSKFDCDNTEIDEYMCNIDIKDSDFDCRIINGFKRQVVPETALCNSTCECVNCADESFMDENHYVVNNSQPVGMFCNRTFKNNVTNLHQWIRTVNVIMTKPAIIKFLKGEIPFFNYLYQHFTIYCPFSQETFTTHNSKIFYTFHSCL